MELKERISDLMAERGLSQKQLASESGVVFATINRLFNRDGYKPSLDTLEGIAKAFGMSVVELLQDESIAIDKQVKGYLEFQGEVAAIRSFTQLKKWYDDVAYNYTTLKGLTRSVKLFARKKTMYMTFLIWTFRRSRNLIRLGSFAIHLRRVKTFVMGYLYHLEISVQGFHSFSKGMRF